MARSYSAKGRDVFGLEFRRGSRTWPAPTAQKAGMSLVWSLGVDRGHGPLLQRKRPGCLWFGI